MEPDRFKTLFGASRGRTEAEVEPEPEDAGGLKIPGLSEMPSDVRRNTYTKDRPLGLHVQALSRIMSK